MLALTLLSVSALGLGAMAAGCGGGTTTVPAEPCDTDADCDDGIACTAESCTEGACRRSTNDAMCDDGVFCNGAEVCAIGRGCLTSMVPACDDGVGCTVDACDEPTRSCTNLADNSRCDDGVFCNGAEVCGASGCAAGGPADCDDRDPCTSDTCDASADACAHGPADADMDGDSPLACGGGDCDDMSAAVSSLITETCNSVDDDCDGTTDEGVTSSCGNCDFTCNLEESGEEEFSTGAGGEGTGTQFDPERGGIVVAADTTDADYLWIPNTNESTLSKWDAQTATELARYRVGLPVGECPARCCWENGCNMPSRVVIDGRGNAYVANRAFAMQGTVTKIAAHIDDCVDRNGNGVIDTSTGPTPMAWDTDECILWNAPVGPVNAVLRAIAIDAGDATHPEGYPWVGGYNTREFYRLNPDDGTQLNLVDVAPLNPYGAVVLSDGRLFIGTLDNNATGFFDTTVAMPTFTRVPYPATRGCSQSYGITADGNGRVWMAGWGCQDAIGYDPATASWTRVPGFGVATGRGITVDGSGNIWMVYGGDGQANVAYWDSNAFAPGGNIPLTSVQRWTLPAGHSGPSGIGADRRGYIWVAHHASSQLVRIDPATRRMGSFNGPNRVYTYSDFTGAVRRTVIGSGTHEQTFDGTCDAPAWSELIFDVDTPMSTSVTFSVRSADTIGGLDLVTPIEVAVVPTATSPVDIAAALAGAGATGRRYMHLSVLLSGSGGISPVVRSYSMRWSCP